MVNEHSLNNGDYYQNGFTETSKLTTFAQVSDTILRHFGLNIHFSDKISIFNLPINSYEILGTNFLKVFCNCSKRSMVINLIGTEITSQYTGKI